VFALDNGYPHNTKKVKEFLKQNKRYLKAFWLPRYAPQLNLIEVDWKAIKEKYFSNFLCKSPDELFWLVRFVFKRLGVSRVLKSKPQDCIIFSRLRRPKLFKNLVRYA
jgi:transposase